MKTRINKKYLDGRFSGIFELQVNPVRVAYIPKDGGDVSIGERGLPEYILTYLALPEHEPELYEIPHQLDIKKQGHEVWLKYQKATIILISMEEDNRFRKENKDLIKELEALCVEGL